MVKRKTLQFSVPEIKAIPVPKGNEHPCPKYSPILPRHEFTWGVISPKGAGKTTFIINMLELYSGYFNEIIIFSPTLLNDDKWDYAKKLPLREENKPLLKFLATLDGDDVEKNKMFPHLKSDKKTKFDPKIPPKNFISVYTPQKLDEILDEQDNMIKFLKSHNQPKYLANKVLMLFDDLVGSDLFDGGKKNTFTRFNTIHRHLSVSCFMISQAFKAIPATVRNQWTCLSLFRIGNEKEVEKIYEEFPMGLNRKNWESLYEFCTEGKYDFMFIDFQKPRGEQIMKNFDTFIMEGGPPPDYSESPSKKQKVSHNKT
jgi:hypothetical protein